MPPTVTKQTPPKPAPPALNGSILSTAVPVTSIKELYQKMVIYGRNRVGKTTLACQWPKPLLLVSFEPSETGGAISVSTMEGVHLVRVASKKLRKPDGTMEQYSGTMKASMLAEELHRSNPFPFKTVVVDTATSYQDIILQEIMGLSAIPEMLSWGLVGEEQYRDRSSKTREALRPFLDLPCHVIVCAQEKDHNPPKDRSVSKLTRGMQMESFFAADLGGATVKWLHDACGYIGQLYEDEVIEKRRAKIPKDGRLVDDPTGAMEEIRTGRRVRRLRTLYHANYAAGFRSATPDIIPEYIEGKTPKEMYEKIVKLSQGIRVQ